MTVLALLVLTAAAAPPDLPDRLPPLDDQLLAEPAALPVSFFGQLRLRGELDDARTFARGRDGSAGAALTGRVGVNADVDGAHLVVVLGDGGRIGLPGAAPALVARPALPFLWQVELSLPVSIAGTAGAVDVGRMPLIVGDGRLVGVEPFDPRGRTLDGVRVRAHTPWLDATLAGVWLGPLASDAADTGPALSALAVLEATARPADVVDVDAYGLLHRDGPDALTLPTAGVRLRGALPVPLLEVAVRAGADVQAPVPDGGGLSARAGHAEAGARATLSPLFARAPALFVDGSGEVTAGDTVKGRVFRAPAPTQHDALGLLDLVAMDNTWSAALALGAHDKGGLTLDVRGRVVGIADKTGPLLDTSFRPLAERTGNGLALLELDAGLEVPLGSALSLSVGYGVAVPGQALVGNEPAQRLLVSLRATAAPNATGAPLPPL